MKKTGIIIGIVCCFVLVSQAGRAQVIQTEKQGGRYVLLMMEGRAVVNNRVPAMILDTVRGIVWTCQNLQDGRPLWVEADLGQNGNKPLTDKKYVGKMLMWQDADLRMPAIVVDTEQGIIWTCPNIVDGNATWIQKDLMSGEEKEILRVEVGVVKRGNN